MNTSGFNYVSYPRELFTRRPSYRQTMGLLVWHAESIDSGKWVLVDHLQISLFVFSSSIFLSPLASFYWSLVAGKLHQERHVVLMCRINGLHSE